VADSQRLAIYRAINLVPAVVCVLALCAIWGVGCGTKKTATNRQLILSNETEGYAYIPVLATEHPLYGELQRLERALYELEGGVLPQSLKPPMAREALVIAGVAPRDYPAWQLENRRLTWQTGTQQELPTGLGALAPDLQARLAWQRRQIRSQAREQLRVAEAEESQRLAHIRVQAVKSRQERLDNLGLDLTIGDSEAAAAAEQERKRIWREIEAELAKERQAGEARLTRLTAKVRAQERKQIGEAVKEVLRRMARRAQAPITSTEPLREAMNEELLGVALPSWAQQHTIRVDTEAAGQMLSSAEQSWDQAMGEMEASRHRQIDRMMKRRVALTKLIVEGTRSATRRIAAELGLTVHFPPLEAAVGVDLTPRLRERLRRLWHGQPGQLGEQTQ